MICCQGNTAVLKRHTDIMPVYSTYTQNSSSNIAKSSSQMHHHSCFSSIHPSNIQSTPGPAHGSKKTLRFLLEEPEAFSGCMGNAIHHVLCLHRGPHSGRRVQNTFISDVEPSLTRSSLSSFHLLPETFLSEI